MGHILPNDGDKILYNCKWFHCHVIIWCCIWDTLTNNYDENASCFIIVLISFNITLQIYFKIIKTKLPMNVNNLVVILLFDIAFEI